MKLKTALIIFLSIFLILVEPVSVAAFSFPTRPPRPTIPPIPTVPPVPDLEISKNNSAVEILSPIDQDSVDKSNPLSVKVAYNAENLEAEFNGKTRQVFAGRIKYVELFLNDKPVALEKIKSRDGRKGSVEIEVDLSQLPEDAVNASLQAKIYSNYIQSKFIKWKNKPLAVSQKILVSFESTTPLEQLKQLLSQYENLNPDEDQDSDGLTNGFEIFQMRLTTLPDNEDTDSNGKKDGEEDSDQDGLTNFDEQTKKTDPLSPDTDFDGLTDKEELEGSYITDPLNPDTDGDTLNDKLEIDLGFDPTKADTDGDGTPDNEEDYQFIQTDSETGVMVEVSGTGTIKEDLIVQKLTDTQVFDQSPDVFRLIDVQNVGNGQLNQATITIPFTLEEINGASQEDLQIVTFDDPEKGIAPLENQFIDFDNNTITGTTTHFSRFGIINITKWVEVFSQKFYGSLRAGTGDLSVVFVIDSSGSMSSTDPSNIRVSAAQGIVDTLGDNDKVGVVDFDGSVKYLQSMTTDKEAAKTALDKIDSSGSTNIGYGVSAGTQLLTTQTTPGQSNRIIILLTDGEGSYHNSYTQTAKDNDIVIYTIGLSTGAAHSLLEGIAAGTNGLYFRADDAGQLDDIFNTIKEEALDTDGDGLSDVAEINGMRTNLGYPLYSNPFTANSDADDLTDGEEMGVVKQGAFGPYYEPIGDPKKFDTDGDTLSDSQEVESGTSAWSRDTDNDGLEEGEMTYLEDRAIASDQRPTEWDFYGSYNHGLIFLSGFSLEEEESWVYNPLDWWQFFPLQEWNHAGIYIGKGLILDSHPNNPNGGVDIKHVEERFFGQEQLGRFAALSVKGSTDQMYNQVRNEAITFRGVGYGVLPFYYVLNGVAGDYYCSELVKKVWEPQGVSFTTNNLWILPRELYHSPQVEVVDVKSGDSYRWR